MRSFCKDRRGYVMAYMVILLLTVGLPMLMLSVEITRAMFVQVQLQTAVDSACDAAVQAVDVPHFISTGVLLIQQGVAASYASREFTSTVINHSLNHYSPSLTGLSFLTLTKVQCTGSASMSWFIPGIPSLTISAVSVAEAKVSM